jgi:hypothetical protein
MSRPIFQSRREIPAMFDERLGRSPLYAAASTGGRQEGGAWAQIFSKMRQHASGWADLQAG